MAKSQIIGAKAHIARLKKLTGPEMKREVGSALFAAGEKIAVEAQNLITAGSSSGTSGGKHQHIASAPGEAPNNFQGGLAGNIEAARTQDPLVVEVTSNAEYAAALEFGTSRMAARPYMQPARDAKRKEAEQLVRQALNRVVKRSKSGDA